MATGVNGYPGPPALRPVEEDLSRALGNVILLLEHMVGKTVLGDKLRQDSATLVIALVNNSSPIIIHIKSQRGGGGSGYGEGEKGATDSDSAF